MSNDSPPRQLALDRKNCWTIAGTAGRIENFQVAMYLTYARRAGARPERPLAVSAQVVDRRSRTLPARRNPAVQNGFRAATGTGRGHDYPRRGRRGARRLSVRRRGLRRRPKAARRHPRSSARLRAGGGGQSTCLPTHAGPIRVDRLAGMLAKRAWQKHSAGLGAWHVPRSFYAEAGDHTDHVQVGPKPYFHANIEP